jgi:hypothetical protein
VAEPLQKHSRAPRKERRDAGLILTGSPDLDAAGKPIIPRRERSSGIATKRPLATLPDSQRAEIANHVLERYIHGEQVADIAKELQTSDVTVYALLIREHEATWADIQKARALARLERHTKSLEVAPTPLSLARHRELVRAAQWELERLFNRIYGHKQEVTVQINHDLGEHLRKARERVQGRVIDMPQGSNPALPVIDTPK